jgi:hypothetical protein
MSEDRYSSRKWILATRTVALYTAVYGLDLAVLVSLRAADLISATDVTTLWSGSRTIWTAGVVLATGIYTTGNVAAKKFADEQAG